MNKKTTNYTEFLKAKKLKSIESGFDCSDYKYPRLTKEFQWDIVKWACKRGKAAIFADTGLGKTLMQLIWADLVSKHTGKPVLLLAPLCVSHQTVREADKFGIVAEYDRHGVSDCMIVVTNYEMLKNFKPDNFAGIVLDESSILKGLNGSVRKSITEFAASIHYRLSCTATPSPNDFMELGTQSEFLGIMSQTEMLATYFVHDSENTSKWRLKGHGRTVFWEWLSTWSVVVRDPSDLGYESGDYDLPELKMIEHVVETEPTEDLFASIALGLQDRNKARKESVIYRCEIAADLLNSWDIGIAWCNLNAESDLVAKLASITNIQGSDSTEKKESDILGFTTGDIKKITTKPKIAGFGLNWQHCNKMVFVGLSDSFESFYQAVRRCWRFGQTEQVEVHIVISDREGAVLDNIKRKQRQHDQMAEEMQNVMQDLTIAQIKGATLEKATYEPSQPIQIMGI